MRHKVYLESEISSGFAIRGLIRRAVRSALSAENIKSSCEVNVLLTDDEGIRRLNREFRGIDKATDVLSFPESSFHAGGFKEDTAERNLETGRLYLGDIALSLERACAQGLEFGHGTKREILYLTVHGLLHLLGYDHVDEGEMKLQMRAREKAILALIERRGRTLVEKRRNKN